MRINPDQLVITRNYEIRRLSSLRLDLVTQWTTLQGGLCVFLSPKPRSN